MNNNIFNALIIYLRPYIELAIQRHNADNAIDCTFNGKFVTCIVLQ